MANPASFSRLILSSALLGALMGCAEVFEKIKAPNAGNVDLTEINIVNTLDVGSRAALLEAHRFLNTGQLNKALQAYDAILAARPELQNEQSPEIILLRDATDRLIKSEQRLSTMRNKIKTLENSLAEKTESLTQTQAELAKKEAALKTLKDITLGQ